MEERRLAKEVASRRRELSLSTSEAARRAGNNRATWAAVEAGRTPHDFTRAGIERALGWAAGSVDVVLHGGSPAVATPARQAQPDSPPPDSDEWVRVEIERIKGLPISLETKKAVIRAVIDMVVEGARPPDEARRSA